MLRRLTLLFLFAVPITSMVTNKRAAAEPIGLIERYALAEDRREILRELIPGSEEYFFLHCLHYQVTGQLSEAEAMLARWEREWERRGTPPSMISIRDRQRLLTYDASPDRTIEHLRDRLNLRFDHPAPRQAGERQWQDRLNDELIAPQSIIEQTIRQNQQLTPAGYALLTDWVLDGRALNMTITPEWLMQRIQGRWTPRLGELAIAELKARERNSRSFGDRAAHQFLTLDELQSIFTAFPELKSSDALVFAILQRLRPDEDSDPAQQPEVRLAYLQRVVDFVRTLPDAQNSLKAASLYRLLEAYAAQGEYPLELFLEYLNLPRQSPIVIYALRSDQRRQPARLEQDYTSIALLPPIVNEEPLVTAYLEHFLRDAESTQRFEGLLEEGYLNRVFAETKLLYGVGDPDRWIASRSPEWLAALTERVELTLPGVNPSVSSADAVAKLQVDLKHVDELMVRIYEINSEAYYREHTKPINTDLDLDGLVATEELRFNYELPAIRRHRETIELPSIQGRGVWIVDFLGGGLRARAILRRGDLRVTERITPDGQEFVVLDENRQPVPTARMLVAGQEWAADDQGHIVLPPVDKALTRQAVLLDNELAVPLLFAHLGEQYSLTAQMLVNRQQLRSGQMAELVVRPRVYMSQEPVAPSVLRNATLTITAVDRDGIETTKRFEDLKWDQAHETIARFRVPARISSLRANLTAKITKLSTGREVEVSTGQSWDVNGIDASSRTSDLHLTRDQDQWVIEARGLNGEALSGYTIHVSLLTSFGQHVPQTTLETDQRGRVYLGELNHVITVTANDGQGSVLSRQLDLASAVWPSRLHGLSSETLYLPLAEDDAQVGRDLRIHSVHGGVPAKDLTTQVLAVEDGLLKLSPLAPGDYRLLHLHDGSITELAISITEGPMVSSIAAGLTRHLEARWPGAVGIASIEADAEGLRVRLSGDASSARVHVLGSRYLPDYDSLSVPLPLAGRRGIDLPENGYVSDLRLGDEYLYVLRRQYANKYPGVMLPQPSLLLAPWVTDETRNTAQTAEEGEMVPESAAAGDRPMAADAMQQLARKQEGASASQNLNFLPDGGALLTNLRPDAEGWIRIPADALAGSVVFRVVVVDPTHTVQQTVARELNDIQPRDLRLASPLAADRSLAFERSVLIAGPNAPLDMKQIGAAQIQIYTELGDLLRLYQTLSGDPRLTEFLELGQWDSLNNDAKRTLYGRLASHELNIFIKKKDPEFFESVVRPYLENKKEKQLVDYWLLGRDLTPWTDMWRYANLNAFEKALLAREVPAMRDVVTRELRERIAMADVSPEVIRRLVEAGLAAQSMDEVAANRGVDRAANAMFFGAEAADFEALGDMVMEKSAAGGFGGGAGGYGAAADPAQLSDGALPAPAAPAGPGGGGARGGRSNVARGRALERRASQLGRFFQQLDSTKQWAENHWDHVRVQQAGEQLIPLDPFWLDWAMADNGATFLSEHLLRPSSNRHAALVALALIDLPLSSEGVELPSDPDAMFTPNQPLAVITKRLRSLEPMEGAASLLVGQRFEAVNGEPVEGERAAQIAPEEFLTGVAYRGQIVLTNPTPQPRTVDCLWQIPGGSLPVAGAQATDSETVEIQPFEVRTIEYQFYFPAAGTFTHYPVCVSSEGKVVARAEERQFNVVETPTKIDAASWEQIARTGSAQQIADFLKQANLRKLNLDLVAHRMRERAVYDAVLNILATQRVWNHEVWGYAVMYRDLPRMKTFLEQQAPLVISVGPVFNSQLLVVHPIQRGFYEHLEYAPLVRARIHPLRPEPEILNDRFLQQYRQLMNVVAHQPGVDDEQEMAISYYLLLQNRIEEALTHFGRIDRSDVELDVQYDYMAAYLAMHRGDYQAASDLADSHVGHPVPRWRERFTEISQQLRQRRDLMSGSQLVNDQPGSDAEPVREDAADLAVMDRERRQSEAAAAVPDARVRVEGDALIIDHRNTEEVTINFYGVDLELLFSKTPFVRDGLQRMAMVRPGRTETVSVSPQGGSSTFRLDDNLARQTLLVEVVTGASRDTTLYYGGKLRTYVSEGFGQLQVSDRTTGQPVSTVYVKVYARHSDGRVEFYKDGYTDLRGRFDYATLSTGNIAQLDRLAILVLDPERGATLHDVAPPK